MSFAKRNNLMDRALQVVVILNTLAALFVLSIYSYGGFFARYLADDYCESVWLSDSRNLLDASLNAYNSWLNSYSILFFVQLTDWAWIWGFRLMSGVTICFWVITGTWFIDELGKALSLKLNLTISIWLAALVIFLSLYQTPVLYQILYWRTGLIPYTLPLAFFAGIAAFILWYVRQPYQKSRAVRMGVLVALLVAFVSGLCETTSALQVGILFLAVTLTWLTRSKHRRMDVVIILAVALFVAVACLLIIAFSPGTSTRLNMIMTDPPLYNPVELAVQVIRYAAHFLWDNLKVTPLPILIALLIPFALLYFQSLNRDESSPRISNSHLWLAILILFLCMFIAIGFSFAPSAFVRTYPAARVRFASHFVMNLNLVITGGMLGVLASQIRLPIKTGILRSMALILLGMLCLYPLYTSSKISTLIPEYKRFAAVWDERDQYIRTAVANGAKDLTVIQLDSMGGVGEYKGDKTHWINLCAAQYYGLNSIIAP